ncbi:hypothetical protein [Streptomyces acidicola]|uniref:hypothetical protein n=1 Tax=Streptomyces acidicola TaxID=2596892 RepID=UPI003822EE69
MRWTRDWMRDWLRKPGVLLGALATAFALVLLGAPSSVAGGPTSVLLASPTSSQTASLYSTDDGYNLLEKLLGRAGSDLDSSEEKPPKLDETIGHSVNVTWLIHDVNPWRVDQVYPLVPETRGVWIHTTMGVPNGKDGIWHKAERPEELRSLLTDLGVMGKAPKTEGEDANASAGRPSHDDVTAAPATNDSPPARAAAASTGLGTNWWWAIPGLAVGAALALALRPLAVRAGWLPSTQWRTGWRHHREPGPRQELRDI